MNVTIHEEQRYVHSMDDKRIEIKNVFFWVLLSIALENDFILFGPLTALLLFVVRYFAHDGRNKVKMEFNSNR